MEKHGNYKHGLLDHPLYDVWVGMKYRCKTNKIGGEYWHGRGIKVCEEWQIFINFYNWAISNGYKRKLTIDRINNDGNYEPSNCRFVNYSIQNYNRRKPKRAPRDWYNY